MQARHECRECGEEVNIKDGYKWFRESDTYECLGCFDWVSEQKHDWDNLDFGTMEEPQCGLCGCRSDNGMWNADDGDLLEDVICDDCDNVWRFDSDRDAYVPRESEESEIVKHFITSVVDEMVSRATIDDEIIALTAIRQQSGFDKGEHDREWCDEAEEQFRELLMFMPFENKQNLQRKLVAA